MDWKEERTKQLLDEFDDHSMDRRNFLGSSLGIFIGTQLPWIAKKHYEKAIEQPQFILSNYRNYIQLKDGGIIQGPGIKEVKDGKMICADILANQQIELIRSIIFYKNKLLSNAKFDGGSQILYNGDTLKITHSFNINYNGKVVVPGDDDWDDILQRYQNKMNI
jgi:hypothetical protein